MLELGWIRGKRALFCPLEMEGTSSMYGRADEGCRRGWGHSQALSEEEARGAGSPASGQADFWPGCRGWNLTEGYFESRDHKSKPDYWT